MCERLSKNNHMADVKGRVDDSATIDIIAERHITLGDIEENYFLWYRICSFIQNCKCTLPLLTM